MALSQLIYGEMMNIDTIISNIYPEINPLKMFPHPKTGLAYTLLSESQLIELANRSLEIMLSMGIEQVIVSESGAIPFARICAWLSLKNNLPFTWYSIKIPRNVNESAQITLKAYLSLSLDELRLDHKFEDKPAGFSFTEPSEAITLPEDYFDLQGKTLIEILETIQKDAHCPHALELTHAAGLTQLLEKPFIFFDEYIDSGKTLFQSFRFFNLFRKDLKFKIFSYLIKLPENQLNKNICASLYTLDTAEKAYQWGVYPFENRMDWLGYFYMANPEEFRKVSVAALCELNDGFSHHRQSASLLHFLDILYQDEFLDDIKRHCQVQDVSSCITKAHFIQYSLYLLEKMHFGNSAWSEFLYQLFDLYGPIWSPLPDHFHLSYLEAFNTASHKIIPIFSSESLKQKYQEIRVHIIPTIARLIEMRRMNQQRSLLHTLEKTYES